MDLCYLLSLVFVSLSLVFVHVLFSCFDRLFLLVFEVMLSSRILLIAILGMTGMLQVVVFVVLELSFVIWYLSAAAVRRLIYSLTIANLLQC